MIIMQNLMNIYNVNKSFVNINNSFINEMNHGIY